MSQRNSGYARKEHEFYPTPAWVTEAVLPFIAADAVIWEPACGEGAMLDVLREAGFSAHGTDIQTGANFFDFQAMLFGANTIFTNPPYNIATEFIEHALALTEPVGGAVALLLRADFDHAGCRVHLFRDHPAFAIRVPLLKRITWFKPPPGERGKSPSVNHTWWIWDWKHVGPAQTRYPVSTRKETACS